MLDVQSLARGAIQEVNPDLPVAIFVSTGATTNADGTRSPTFQTVLGLSANVQALTFRDIQQIASLNLQGTRRAIYLFGEFDGIIRSKTKGGDLIVFPDGTTWLVALVLEQWRTWCKVAATLQDTIETVQVLSLEDGKTIVSLENGTTAIGSIITGGVL